MAVLERARMRDRIAARFERPHLYFLREAPYAPRLDRKGFGAPFRGSSSERPVSRRRVLRAALVAYRKTGPLLWVRLDSHWREQRQGGRESFEREASGASQDLWVLGELSRETLREGNRAESQTGPHATLAGASLRRLWGPARP